MRHKPDKGNLPQRSGGSQHTPSDLVHTRTEVSLYSGPLPDPRTLAEYEVVLPGAAERIFAVFERQGGHRMGIERWAVINDIIRGYLGWAAALGIAAGGIYVAYLLGMAKHDWLAGTFFGGTLCSLVGAFLYGRNKQAEERIQKAELMAGEQQRSKGR